ncbi:MAG: 4-(cytidine 5'-diphospho)-2-C-methyl-D-erythritol kinase [Clostridia bacterium]|nr:4-(cytidine 5'-diphospho)-2-C-methyl-D-erythritol kinase [Clostridia bacterium]
MVNAFAKINLTLEVGGKRADGYHSLVSVMARATLSDRIEVKKNGSKNIVLKVNDPSLDTPDNLAVKAVKGYCEASGIEAQGVDILLEKNIPVASGLGGGSADAAAVIECMEELFGALPRDKRHALARSLGADVPYCLEKTPCICRGIGDECEKIDCKGFDSLYLVIKKNAEKLSTGAVYTAFDALSKKEGEYDHVSVVKALERGDTALLTKSLFNDFERVVLDKSPEVKVLKEEMMRAGALAALMSGAGPTVVGFFDDEEKARAYSSEFYRIV